MTTTAATNVIHTPGNRSKLAQVEALLAQLLADNLRRGYFGTLSVELAIQDGTIQQIRCRTERVER